MKLHLAAACAALALAGGAAWADPPAAARPGLDALSRGDNDAAARLFSEALLYGRLTRQDRELVYVKRAEAFLAVGNNAYALADANRALALNPADAEAVQIRDKAAPAVAAAPPVPVGAADPTAASAEPSITLNAKIKSTLEAVESRNKAAYDKYQSDMAAYAAKQAADAAQVKANDDAYATSLAAHKALVDAMERKNAADIADWQARVEACKHGDYTQCAPPPKPGPNPGPETGRAPSGGEAPSRVF